MAVNEQNVELGQSNGSLDSSFAFALTTVVARMAAVPLATAPDTGDAARPSEHHSPLVHASKTRGTDASMVVVALIAVAAEVAVAAVAAMENACLYL